MQAFALRPERHRPVLKRWLKSLDRGTYLPSSSLVLIAACFAAISLSTSPRARTVSCSEYVRIRFCAVLCGGVMRLLAVHRAAAVLLLGRLN